MDLRIGWTVSLAKDGKRKGKKRSVRRTRFPNEGCGSGNGREARRRTIYVKGGGEKGDQMRFPKLRTVLFRICFHQEVR